MKFLASLIIWFVAALPGQVLAEESKELASHRTLFFSWCIGSPWTVEATTLDELERLDAACAQLAERRIQDLVAMAGAPKRPGDDGSSIILKMLNICREMVERRSGRVAQDARCSDRDRRMVQSALNLPEVFDAHFWGRWTMIAGTEPEPQDEEARKRLTSAVPTGATLAAFRSYLSDIGMSCETSAPQQMTCHFKHGELGFAGKPGDRAHPFIAAIFWEIDIDQNADGTAIVTRVRTTGASL